MKIADVIIQKLDALSATNKILLERVYALEGRLSEDNFLSQEYTAPLVSTPKPKQVNSYGGKRKGAGRTKGCTISKQLPPTMTRALRDDTKLAESTRKTYANLLNVILAEPDNFVDIIRLRNDGILSKDIAELMPDGSRLKNPARISNCVTVSRRYGLMELHKGKYITTSSFYEHTGIQA